MRDEPPLIGIVMPTHGANPFLEEAVRSVIAQTHEAWHLVIVCDGASPETARLAAGFAARDARIRVVQQSCAGVGKARNRGLGNLPPNVSFIALLDHDDRWLPSTLAMLLAPLAASSTVIVGAHGLARYIDEEGQFIRPGELEADMRRRRGIEQGKLVDWPISRPTMFANLVLGDCIPVGTALVRRAAFDRVGRFDERAVPSDDYDMWLRLTRLGDFALVDDVVMEYRQHAAPTWVRPKALGRGLPYVQRKMITSAENSPEQAQLAREGYRALQALMARMDLETSFSLVRHGNLRAGFRSLLRSGKRTSTAILGAPGPWHT
jgi:glycosyltransferase involved in cell wall biosynthesis